MEFRSRFRKFSRRGCWTGLPRDWLVPVLAGKSRVVASEFRGSGQQYEARHTQLSVWSSCPPADRFMLPSAAGKWNSSHCGVQDTLRCLTLASQLRDLKRKHIIVRPLPARFPGRSLPDIRDTGGTTLRAMRWPGQAPLKQARQRTFPRRHAGLRGASLQEQRIATTRLS